MASSEQPPVSRGEGNEPFGPSPSPILARMGMQLFLVSLGIFFGASIVAIVIIRNSNPNWGAGAPRIPDLAWLSTGVMLLVSVFSQLGLKAVRRDSTRSFKIYMVLVLALGFLFLILQEQVWRAMLLAGEETSFSASSSLHGWSIYVLGLLHALHVAGGLIFQGYVTTHALRGGYWSLHCEMVRHVNLYWHFLDGVWVGLFAFLLWLA
ncbi:MAG: cytochrome c oxidase subunit 3 [Planctomycetota bacterium]|nr:cytochrome c oxidase subunit 3 [Planctomycetota bacterium]